MSKIPNVIEQMEAAERIAKTGAELITLEKLRVQNARLAAAINETASVYGFTRPPDCLRALREVLAPTIELLEQLTYPAVNAANNEIVHKELNRLRELCGERTEEP